MKSIIYFILFLGLGHTVFAQAQEGSEAKPQVVEGNPQEKTLWEKTKELGSKTLEKGAELAENYQNRINQIPGRRVERDFGLTGSYSYFDFWTFGKMGLAGSWQAADHSWDLEYQHGSIGYGVSLADLGKFSEDRIHLVKRSYGNRNTFNWYYGPYYNKFSFKFGDRIMSTITNGSYPNAELLNVETAGICGGLGNRWQFRNGFTVGVDWFELNWPLVTLKKSAAMLDSDASESDKKTVRDGIDVLRHVPAIAIGKISVGRSF